MGTYKKYTITKKIPLPVFFKCHHCQQENTLINTFSIQSTYNDKGAFSKNEVAKREAAARDNLAWQEAQFFTRLIGSTNRRAFMNAGYNCKCQSCKKAPLWSDFRIKAVDSISSVAVFVGLILLLIWLYGTIDNGFSFSGLMPALLVFGIGNLPALIIYSIKGIKIRAMGKEYMPVVSKDAAHLRQTMETGKY